MEDRDECEDQEPATTMITGFRTSVLIPAAKKAPPEDPARAASPIRTAVRTSTGALRAYVTAAPVVPTAATALLVPSACAAGVPDGRPSSTDLMRHLRRTSSQPAGAAHREPSHPPPASAEGSVPRGKQT